MNSSSCTEVTAIRWGQVNQYLLRTGNTSGRFHQGLLVMLPPQLEAEVQSLKQQYAIDIVEEASVINLVIRAFRTSDLYSKPTTNLLLRIPRSYPEAGLDMFWTDLDLILKNGSTPNGAGQIEQYSLLDALPDLKGKQWRRFSWHPQYVGGSHWNPNIDNLVSYLEFVRRRFGQQ